MKQLLILSGKGGTGKTTIASAFIRLTEVEAYADCDVDAPNLHLIMNQDMHSTKTEYYGMPKAEIDSEVCIQCGQCRQNCRFDAIKSEQAYQVDPFACEGCGVCEAICPVEAISLKPHIAGELSLYKDETHVFSTAQLKMGSGTSGKLVTEVKNQMKSSAKNAEFAIVDGSPGIGCPVIASLSGVDMVLIVAEPSISGISDMKRILETAKIFQVKTAVCINKYDTNPLNSKEIEKFCKEQQVPFIGKVPFDSKAVEAINHGKTIADIDCISGDAVKGIYQNAVHLLFNNN